MTKEIIRSLKALLFFSLLLGLLYPLVITMAARSIFPAGANGSLFTRNNQVAGSTLIGQSFREAGYFQTRPSAVDYNACASGASNMGPTSKTLMDQVAERIRVYRNENDYFLGAIPPDAVLSSASGLDPHISIENAFIQAKRIALARTIPLKEIHKILQNTTDDNFIGLWGGRGVNVLEANIALDDFSPKEKERHQ